MKKSASKKAPAKKPAVAAKGAVKKKAAPVKVAAASGKSAAKAGLADKNGRDAVKSAIPCNICGGTQFKAGPNGRLSTTQKHPVCVNCGALERHRAYRDIFNKIRSPALKDYSCLSFNRDRSIAGGWFKSIMVTESGSRDALDIEDLSLANESVDVVVCNHVLGGVRDYVKAFKELVRVTSRKGFAFISFGNPHHRQKTDDWGFADPKRHGLYRSFGADIEGKLRSIIPGVGIARLVGQDPVTGVEDRAYVLSRNLDLLGALGEKGLKIRFLHF